MPVFLDPSGRSTFGIGVCARCWQKFSLEDLFSDPNSPGLKVCKDDLDDYDPYRLPARRTEDVTLRFYRPDEDLTAGGAVPNTTSLNGVRGTIGGNPRITAGGDLRVLESATLGSDDP
jgi:hypothetical protein